MGKKDFVGRGLALLLDEGTKLRTVEGLAQLVEKDCLRTRFVLLITLGVEVFETLTPAVHHPVQNVVCHVEVDLTNALLDVFSRQMEKWAEKGKIVVFATQVVNEGSNMEIYEVGRRVKKEFSIIEAYDMTLEATVTKLMVLTGRFGNDYKSIRREFYAPVNFDILYEDGN